jgi:hypothetical protein
MEIEGQDKKAKSGITVCVWTFSSHGKNLNEWGNRGNPKRAPLMNSEAEEKGRRRRAQRLHDYLKVLQCLTSFSRK